MGLRFLTLCVATALALACAPLSFGQGGFDAPVDERRYTPPEAGWWGGALRIDDRLSVGCYFELPPIAFEGVHPATIANGREKIEVAAAWEEGTLTLDFPHYDASIRSHRALVGSEIGLFGEYRKTVSEGEQRVMTFEAVPIGPARPSPAFRNSSALPVGTPRADFEGEWKIDFEKSGPAKAIFRQPGGGVAVDLGAGQAGVPAKRLVKQGVIHAQPLPALYDIAYRFVDPLVLPAGFLIVRQIAGHPGVNAPGELRFVFCPGAQVPGQRRQILAEAVGGPAGVAVDLPVLGGKGRDIPQAGN